jgi:hypothetical protein
MCICPPNIKDSFLIICKIITFKVDGKVFFAYARGGQQSFGGQKNPFFGYIYGMSLFEFLFIGELDIFPQKSHIYKMCGTLRKASFSARGLY